MGPGAEGGRIWSPAYPGPPNRPTTRHGGVGSAAPPSQGTAVLVHMSKAVRTVRVRTTTEQIYTQLVIYTQLAGGRRSAQPQVSQFGS